MENVFDHIKESYTLVKPQYLLATIACLTGSILAFVFPPALLQVPALCGVALFMQALLDGKKAGFKNLFSNHDNFKEKQKASVYLLGFLLLVVLASGVVFGIMYLIVVNIFPKGFLYYSGNGTILGILSKRDFYDYAPPVIILIPTIITALWGLSHFIRFIFVCHIMLDANKKALEALKESYRLVTPHKWFVMRLVLLNLVFSLVASIFYLPISFASLALAYKKCRYSSGVHL